MRKKPIAAYRETPADGEALRQFQFALRDVTNLPLLDQWSTVLELLPDTFLCYVMQSRKQAENVMMHRLGPLAVALWSHFSEEAIDPTTLTASLYGLVISCGLELEKRRGVFCETVHLIENPFTIAISEIPPYLAKDPENFDLGEMLDYYGKECAATK